MKIGLFYHENLPAEKFAKKVSAWLKKKKHHPIINRVEGIKLAIVFGGDGAILHTANKIAKRELLVPIIRVNFGTVGFLTNVDPDDVFDRLSEFLDGKNYIFVKKSRIKVTAERRGKNFFEGDALNDAFIERRSVKATSFFLENSLVSGPEGSVTLKGDGIIFSTKTGSTAYNRSAHGPILVREDNMAVTMICPNGNPWSHVFHLDEATSIVLSVFQKGNARLVVDGMLVAKLKPEDIIIIEKSDKSTVFVEFGDKI